MKCPLPLPSIHPKEIAGGIIAGDFFFQNRLRSRPADANAINK
jgi:hypothetical protein